MCVIEHFPMTGHGCWHYPVITRQQSPGPRADVVDAKAGAAAAAIRETSESLVVMINSTLPATCFNGGRKVCIRSE